MRSVDLHPIRGRPDRARRVKCLLESMDLSCELIRDSQSQEFSRLSFGCPSVVRLDGARQVSCFDHNHWVFMRSASFVMLEVQNPCNITFL